MFVYRLEPIDLDHPSWQKSSHKGRLWVEAINEKDARDRVTDATDRAIPTGGALPRLRSPWELADVTRCVPEGRRKMLQRKGVVTESGACLSLSGDFDPAE